MQSIDRVAKCAVNIAHSIGRALHADDLALCGTHGLNPAEPFAGANSASNASG